MKILLITLLLPSMSFAQTQNLKQNLKQILNTLNNSSIEPSAAQCAPEINHRDLQNKCAIQICGTPEKNVGTLLSNQNAIEIYSHPDQVSKFDSYTDKIKEHLKHWEKENTVFFDRVESYSSNWTKSWNFDEWSAAEQDQVAEEIFRPFYSSKIDYSKPLNQRYILIPRPRKDATPKFKAALQDFLDKKQENIQRNFFKALEEGFYTFEELKPIMQDIWKETQAKTKDRPLAEWQVGSLESAKQIIMDGTAEHIYDFDYALRLIDYADGSIFKKVVSCHSKVCHEGLKEKISSLDIKKFLENARKANSPEVQAEEIDKCRSVVALAASKDIDTSEMKKEIPVIKQKLLKGFMSSMSDPSRTTVSNYLDALEIKFEGAVGNVDDILQKINYASIGQDYPSLGDVSQGKDLKRVLRMGLNRPFPFQDFNLCGKAWGSVARGKFHGRAPEMYSTSSSDKDYILLSAYDCKHPKEGGATLLHEMGHALSDLNSKNKFSTHSAEVYKQKRMCSNSFYKDPEFTLSPQGPWSQRYDHMRGEEDMADMVEFESGDISSRGSFCSLLYRNTDNKYEFPDTLTFKTSISRHSPTLVRILRHSMHQKHALPNECKQLVELYSNEINWEKCP